jgi:hypothetical protein
MSPKVGLVEETKRGGEEGMILNNNKIDHIGVGTRHKETCWTC